MMVLIMLVWILFLIWVLSRKFPSQGFHFINGMRAGFISIMLLFLLAGILGLLLLVINRPLLSSLLLMVSMMLTLVMCVLGLFLRIRVIGLGCMRQSFMGRRLTM